MKIKISKRDLLELVFWARRYCDRRSTYAPVNFNKVYKRLKIDNPSVFPSCDEDDHTLTENGKYWPYAQDGMHDEKNGWFDATK